MNVQIVRNGSKSFGNRGKTKSVLRNFDFSIEKGTCVALLGPNACGKTTLLRVVLGQEQLDEGSVPLRLSRDDLRGTVLQNYRSLLLPLSSVRTNLLLPLGGKESNGSNEASILKVSQDFFQRLEYGIHLSDRVQELSGGQQQSVVLARALAYQATHYIWDEPMSAIDFSRRGVLYSILQDQWRQRGCSVVMVTHYLDEALMLANRVVVLGSSMDILLDLSVKCPKDGTRDTSFLDSDEGRNVRRQVLSTMMGRHNGGSDH